MASHGTDKKRMSARLALAPLIDLQRDDMLSLQIQIRSRILHLIQTGLLSPNAKMPSTRKLSTELSVSRNTVSLAYQYLIGDGHLYTKARSGVFVSPGFKRQTPNRPMIVGQPAQDDITVASERLNPVNPASRRFRCPPDWHRFEYPFIEGRYDRSLFPVSEWREVSRLALGVKEVEQWSIGNDEADDEMLVDAVRSTLLSRRGIEAGRDEILITMGEQQGLYLLAELFATRHAKVIMEDPGLPDLRELFSLNGAMVSQRTVDGDGLVVGEGLGRCDLIHVSPSRQRPSGVTMTLDRRHALLNAAQKANALIIEDDFECEMNFLNAPLPSLYSLDREGRVIYLGAISKVLDPGIRLGFMVAPREVIAAARRLRNLTTRRPSPNAQRAAAYFLTLGHYDKLVRRLRNVYETRLLALRDALNHYRPMTIAIPAVSGGTSYWVHGPEGLNVERLATVAEAQGILIEPASTYFADPKHHRHIFRLGVTSLPSERVRPGVERLSKIITQLCAAPTEHSAYKDSERLSGPAIQSALERTDLLYNTVYGEPCMITLKSDGTMSGKSGYANEDRDVGRWWIEGDKWCRQWQNWAYGETAKFFVRLSDDRVFWINDDGQDVDNAVIARR
jgi:GntR family transcriptional regulator/MocR family aminotransferase